MKRRGSALAILALLAVAGCGSTVSLSSGQGAAVGGTLDAGQALTSGASGGTDVQAPGTGEIASASSTAPGETSPLQSGAPAPSDSDGSTSTAVTGGGPTASQNVQGVTKTTVKLGVEYIDAAALNAYATAAGANGTGGIDSLSAYKAAAAAVNKAGGAGGRQIELVPYKRSVSDSNSQVAQAECAAWTEDNHVFAATASSTQGSGTVTCLSKRHVLSIGSDLVEAGSQAEFDRYAPYYVAPDVADTVTAAKAYIQALIRQGFLTTKSTVGLLWFDFPDFVEARSKGLLPALKAAGIPLKTEFKASYSGSPTDLAPIAAQMQNASLHFRSEGVNRIITLDYQGTLEFFFMTNAQQQGYHPKYGLGTWSDAEFLRSNESAKQLEGSTGIGWLPGYDLQPSQQPTSPARQRCDAAMKASNLPRASAQTDVLVVAAACSTVFHLADLLNSTQDLTAKGIAAAQAALGKRLSYGGFSNSFGMHKLWGAASYRDLAYATKCSCFSYSGPEHSF